MDAYPVVLQHRTISTKKDISLVSGYGWGASNDQVQMILESSTHVQHIIRIPCHFYQSVRMSQ